MINVGFAKSPLPIRVNSAIRLLFMRPQQKNLAGDHLVVSLQSSSSTSQKASYQRQRIQARVSRQLPASKSRNLPSLSRIKTLAQPALLQLPKYQTRPENC